MLLEHQFVVPVPVGQAWDVLLDVERIAPCMPGATVESYDGETVHGRVKVKVGPIQVTYSGTTNFLEKDEGARRVKLDARGREARGSGTVKATILAVLVDEGASTKVTVTTDLAITGKPAQFGRGVMVEVGNKLLGRFAECLAEEIGGGSVAEAGAEPVATSPGAVAVGNGAGGPVPTGGGSVPGASGPVPTGGGSVPGAGAVPGVGEVAAPPPPLSPVRRASGDEAIDLLDLGGAAVAKRVAPLVVGLLVLFLLWRHRRLLR